VEPTAPVGAVGVASGGLVATRLGDRRGPAGGRPRASASTLTPARAGAARARQRRETCRGCRRGREAAVGAAGASGEALPTQEAGGACAWSGRATGALRCGLAGGALGRVLLRQEMRPSWSALRVRSVRPGAHDRWVLTAAPSAEHAQAGTVPLWRRGQRSSAALSASPRRLGSPRCPCSTGRRPRQGAPTGGPPTRSAAPESGCSAGRACRRAPSGCTACRSGSASHSWPGSR